MSDENLIARLEGSLSRIGHLLKSHTRQNLSDWGLSHPRFKVLLYVKHHPDIKMIDLTKQLHQAKSGVTGLVDELVSDGLLSRYRDEQDRRVVRLSLTSRGSEVLGKILEFRRGLVGGAVDGLPEEDVKQMADLLEAIEVRLRK